MSLIWAHAILVITDDRKAEGDRLAERLGRELIGLRGTTTPPYLSADEAIDLALAAEPGKPMVVADPSDNPGGGAPGDSTHVLRRLMERGVRDVAFGPLWDPVAVRFCFAAGEGAILPLRFGGKTAPASGLPIDAEVTVRRLVRDARQSFAGGHMAMGDAAAIEVGGIEIVLIAGRTQSLGTDLFSGMGIDLATKRIVCLKSTNHFYAAFAPIARDILYLDANGPLPRDLRKVPYRHVRRPLWPLDENPWAASAS